MNLVNWIKKRLSPKTPKERFDRMMSDQMIQLPENMAKLDAVRKKRDA